jgi:hypothetical protein
MHVCDHSIREGVGSKAAMPIKTTLIHKSQIMESNSHEEALLAGFVG